MWIINSSSNYLCRKRNSSFNFPKKNSLCAGGYATVYRSPEIFSRPWSPRGSSGSSRKLCASTIPSKRLLTRVSWAARALRTASDLRKTMLLACCQNSSLRRQSFSSYSASYAGNRLPGLFTKVVRDEPKIDPAKWLGLKWPDGEDIHQRTLGQKSGLLACARDQLRRWIAGAPGGVRGCGWSRNDRGEVNFDVGVVAGQRRWRVAGVGWW